jgi:hypothetical protein
VEDLMRRSRIVLQVLGSAGLAVAGLIPLHVPAYGDCEIVSATHGGNWQGEALSGAQTLAARSARDLKAKKGWRGIKMKARQVKPDPFFKTVRPQVSTNLIVGSYVTARTYTTCWTGVTVPFVCTSGAQVCGN